MGEARVLGKIIVPLVAALLAGAITGACSDSPIPIPWCHPRPSSGKVIIAGKVTDCPTITMFEVAPQRLAVGEDALLKGAAMDPDSNNLSFSWTATAGSISDPSLANTTYQCVTPGTETLTLTVSDGTCDDTVNVQVECTP